MKDGRHPNHLEQMEKRKVILAALSRATEDAITPHSSTIEHDEVTGEYYTLTQEEMDALINGDIEKIENWVSSLNTRQAAWLLRWLIRDNL
jgi:hypothetical protein